MKKIILISFLLQFILQMGFTQDLNNNRLGITFTPLVSKCYVFNDNIHEDKYYVGRSGYNMGFNYMRKLKNNFYLESGINYSKLKVYISKEIILKIPTYPRLEQRDLISIPVGFLKEFKHRFFISAGILTEFEFNQWTRLHVDEQDGLGTYLSIGKTFQISENTYFTIAPVVKAHALVPFHANDDQQRLFDYGVKFDFAYGFLR